MQQFSFEKLTFKMSPAMHDSYTAYEYAVKWPRAGNEEMAVVI